jgi:hypothetical protein
VKSAFSLRREEVRRRARLANTRDRVIGAVKANVRKLAVTSARVTALIAASVCLAGCVQFVPMDPYDGPVSMRRVDSGIEIAICDDILGSMLSAEVRNPDLGVDWYRFIDATGEHQFTGGDIVTPDTVPVGLVATISEQPKMEKGSQISVLVRGDDETINVLISPSESDLDSGEWVHPDGASTATACATL